MFHPGTSLLSWNPDYYPFPKMALSLTVHDLQTICLVISFDRSMSVAWEAEGFLGVVTLFLGAIFTGAIKGDKS